MAVIEAAARERKAKLIKVGTRFRWAFVDVNARGQVGILSNLDHEYRVELPLLGLHQLENAACAIAAAEALEQQGFDLTYDAILRGLAATSWPCRLDVLARSPLVVADGAHNPYAVKTVGASLELYLPHFRRVLIVGLTAGHDAEGIAAELARLEPMTVIATRTRHPRSLPAAQVAEMLRAHGLNVQEAADVPQALEKARGIAGKADMVLGIGSLFIAAEMREVMKGIPPEVYPEINVSKQTKGTV
jgi:dihydrofolate synthase/folylpolyglutamate synthase